MRHGLILLAAILMAALPAEGQPSRVAPPKAAPPPARDADAAEKKPPSIPLELVELRGERFKLEVAATREDRAQGLMWRTEIEPNGGMIFIYPDVRRRSFWMANCFVDIDLMFLDQDGMVVRTHRMKVERPRAPRETRSAYQRRLRHYSSRRPAQFAIELQAGSLDRLDVRMGDHIALDLHRLKRMAR
jgi:uncharacterized membrane protein (UPF0127 family)